MSNKLTSEQLEKLSHFEDAFPDNDGVRTAQKGAYNAVHHYILTMHKTICSIFVPTGVGKNDLIRQIAIGLVQKNPNIAGVWVFSPSTTLRTQVKEDGIHEMYQRLGEPARINPFMEMDDLVSNRFRDGCILESYTIQFLTTGDNCSRFISHAERIRRKCGKPPMVIIDETHLLSNANIWGSCVEKFIDAGIPVVVLTGSPNRSDYACIPGFEKEVLEEFDRKFTKVANTDDPLQIKVMKGVREMSKYRLIADYEYSYRRAWDDGIILQPMPEWVDATSSIYEGLLSEMSKQQSERILRTFLFDERTIEFVVRRGIESLRAKKATDYCCAAIVASLSDEEEGGGNGISTAYADMHARKIRDEFQKQAPDLKVMVVTSNENSDDGLKTFKTRTDYDVLIVKAMGTIGYNCRRIKTVINMSNFRTLPFLIQLINRGCRQYGGIKYYDVIMPKDTGMIELWNCFREETGYSLEVLNERIESEQVTQSCDEDSQPIKRGSWLDYENSFDVSKRSVADEQYEQFRATCPEITNRVDRQVVLDLVAKLSLGLGDDWLQKIPKDLPQESRLIDMNEEESRLRGEANSLVKEVTSEVCELSGEKYGDIVKLVWTAVKRKANLPPNQTLKGLAGFDNYTRVVAACHEMKQKLRVRDDTHVEFIKSFGR